MISLLYTISFYSILAGILLALYECIKNQEWKKAIYIVFIPFYVIYYILKLEAENPRKKYTTILVLGAFLVFFFVSILRLLFLIPPT